RDSIAAREPATGQSFRERQTAIAEADAKFPALAHELSDMILGPAIEKIKAKHLIIVPDGGLNYLPISALPIPNSNSDDPLLLSYEVSLEPSAQTLVLLTEKRSAGGERPARDLLIVTDPAFTRDDAPLSGDGRRT